MTRSEEQRREEEEAKPWGRRRRTEEVDDEAAVGAAAGGLAEEGHPIGRARGGERLGRAVDDEVAGVGERVAEAEDGLVRLLAPAGGGAARRCRREEEQRGDEQHAPAPGTRGEGGHCGGGCRQQAAPEAHVQCGKREKRGSLLVWRLALLCLYITAATVPQE